jgi:hypothetical protein
VRRFAASLDSDRNLRFAITDQRPSHFFWRRARSSLKCPLLMTKRDIPNTSTRQTVKLITSHDGELRHYLEPSVACAAQHAINICDHEEGCAQSIEANGEILWKFDPVHPRNSLAQLDELAQGECVR